MQNIAILHTAGKLNQPENIKNERIKLFKENGFLVTEMAPSQPSLDNCTGGAVLERAALLSHALTMRKYDIIFAARGGVGTTELIPFLEHLLPPVLPNKTFVGYSDNSFLGHYLALRFPNLRYIHARHAFEQKLTSGPLLDQKSLFNLLKNKVNEIHFPFENYEAPQNKVKNKIKGVCIPINLSLAESLSCIKHIELPNNNILFLEECNEHLYRIIRKLDSLINSGFLNHTNAIVIGDISGCLDHDESTLNPKKLLKIIALKTNLPTYFIPIFGHGVHCFPLVAHSQVEIDNSKSNIYISNKMENNKKISTSFSPDLYKKIKENHNTPLTIHMTGIGGTGMAQVAGLFKSAGHHITGSDNPIYPPMDKVIAELGIKPDVGFLAQHIQQHKPDCIVLANVVSRLSASLKKNEELEYILSLQTPMMSFPSALRKYFLSESTNIIISGTHGKTTTSSLATHLLTELNENPSFLIGGRPANFNAGFSLRSQKLFVLEGDEYDSAFFDKGPKFLHYVPKITLINNIEFDHADIYPNVEAIEHEFARLAKLTEENNGFVIANFDDERALKAAVSSGADIIGFSENKKLKSKFPVWILKEYTTHSDGIEVTCLTPEQKEFTFKTGVFGKHNALNAISTLAILQAHSILQEREHNKKINHFAIKSKFLQGIKKAMSSFKGVKRRFELIQETNNISVFDDFAHHPTAIVTTLEAFRNYMKSVGKRGKLIACFDPRNATMRRRVLQEQLSKSFFHADKILLGKVPEDLRMQKDEVLDGPSVAKACGQNARYFDDNEKLLATLIQEAKPGDTIVFMSSGSFDGIPYRFAKELS